jgi:hypothetical protein
MANALYGKGRNKFARGDILWKVAGDTIRCCLLKTAYAGMPQIDNHEWWTDLGANVVGNAGAATRAACPQLTLADPALGVCDAVDITITAVPGGVGICDYLAIFKDSGVDGTSPLIALIATATGLPVTPNGGDITIQFDEGANKIFKL